MRWRKGGRAGVEIWHAWLQGREGEEGEGRRHAQRRRRAQARDLDEHCLARSTREHLITCLPLSPSS